MPTGVPSSQPSGSPTCQPSSQPTGEPTSVPSGSPTGQPTSVPSKQPTSHQVEFPRRNLVASRLDSPLASQADGLVDSLVDNLVLCPLVNPLRDPQSAQLLVFLAQYRARSPLVLLRVSLLASLVDSHPVNLVQSLVDNLVDNPVGSLVDSLQRCPLHQVALRVLSPQVSLVECPQVHLVANLAPILQANLRANRAHVQADSQALCRVLNRVAAQAQNRQDNLHKGQVVSHQLHHRVNRVLYRQQCLQAGRVGGLQVYLLLSLAPHPLDDHRVSRRGSRVHVLRRAQVVCQVFN